MTIGGKKAAGESKSEANTDLLQLERNTTAFEKRLLVCTKGENLSNASLLQRTPPTIGPTPESSVLGRIRSFLPTLDEANRKLFSDIQARGAEEFNIENLDEAEQRYVEMELALGVADLHNPAAVAAAELAVNSHVQHGDKFRNSSDCSTDGDSDEEEGLSGNDMQSLLEIISSREDPKDRKELKRKKIEQL